MANILPHGNLFSDWHHYFYFNWASSSIFDGIFSLIAFLLSRDIWDLRS